MISLTRFLTEAKDSTFGYCKNPLADLFMCMIFKSKKEDKLDKQSLTIAKRTTTFVNSICSRGQSCRYKRIYCLKKEYDKLKETAKIDKISNKYGIEFKKIEKIELPKEKDKKVKKFTEVNGTKFVIMQSPVQFNIFFSPDNGNMYTFELVLSKQKFLDEEE